MKYSEVKELAEKELVEMIKDEKANLVRMKMNHAISPLENPLKIREVRKTIARLNTELRRRQLEQQKNK
jgi:large subunit ribosomal protein L29